MNDLKLFVWEGFCNDYTEGLAFAIAKDENEARLLVKQEFGCEPWSWGHLTVYMLDSKISKAVGGGG